MSNHNGTTLDWQPGDRVVGACGAGTVREVLGTGMLGLRLVVAYDRDPDGPRMASPGDVAWLPEDEVEAPW